MHPLANITQMSPAQSCSTSPHLKNYPAYPSLDEQTAGRKLKSGCCFKQNIGGNVAQSRLTNALTYKIAADYLQ